MRAPPPVTQMTLQNGFTMRRQMTGDKETKGRMVKVAVIRDDGTIYFKDVELTVEYIRSQMKQWNTHPEFRSRYV